MKIAVIDMGTNTFHLLIVEVEGKKFSTIYREKSAVKIGEKGINEGVIIPEAADRALATLKRFKAAIDTMEVTHVFATATSAIRNAINGKELVLRIKKEVGLEVRIISGIEEAEYIYYGVAHALNLGQEPSLIMDIGGGSIEFIIGNANSALWKHSFEIGGLRMVEQFHKNDPILFSEIEQVEQYLASHLTLLFQKVIEFQPTTLVGSSGTFDTLSDIFRITNSIEKSIASTEVPLTLAGFDIIYKQIIDKSRAERLAIDGMIELRVDMIVVATILIDFVLKNTKIKNIRVSSYALKEGVLLNTIHSLPLISETST
jgi:exopolyphosphatase/guanosine-5'-triphosphate,3'-diphosphate pyrophosphatase